MVMGDSPLSYIERTSILHDTSPKLFDSFGISNSSVPDKFIRDYNFSTSYKPPLKEIKRANESNSNSNSNILPTIDHDKQYQLHDESEQFDIVQIISNYSQHNSLPIQYVIPGLAKEGITRATSIETPRFLQHSPQKDSENVHSYVDSELKFQNSFTTEGNTYNNAEKQEEVENKENKEMDLVENQSLEVETNHYQSFVVHTKLLLETQNENECELDIPRHTNEPESPDSELNQSRYLPISPDSIQFFPMNYNFNVSNANCKPQPGKRGRKRKNPVPNSSASINHTVTDFKHYDIWNPLIFPSANPGNVSPFISTPSAQSYVSFGIPPHVRGNKTENIAELFNSIVKHTSFMNRIPAPQQPTSKIESSLLSSIHSQLNDKQTENSNSNFSNQETICSSIECNGKYKIGFTLKAFKRINGNQPWVDSNIAPPMIGKMRKMTIEFNEIPVPLKLNITITPISTKGNQSKLVISESNRVYKKCHKNEGSDKVSYYFEPSKVKQIKTFYLKPRWVCFGPRKERPEFRVVISVANVNTSASNDNHSNSNLPSCKLSPSISQTKSIVDPSKFHYNEDINNSITTVIYNISSAQSSGNHGEIPSPSNLNLSPKAIEELKTRLKLSLLDYGKALGLHNNKNNNNNNSGNIVENIDKNNNNNFETENEKNQSQFDSMDECDESENEIETDDETDEDLDAAESIEALTGLKRSREEIEEDMNEKIIYNGFQKLANNTDFQRDVDANDIILHAWKTEIHCHKMESSIRGKLMDNYHPPSSLSDTFYL